MNKYNVTSGLTRFAIHALSHSHAELAVASSNYNSLCFCVDIVGQSWRLSIGYFGEHNANQTITDQLATNHKDEDEILQGYD